MLVVVVIGGMIAIAGCVLGLQSLSQYSDYKRNRRIGESYDAFCHRSYSRYL